MEIESAVGKGSTWNGSSIWGEGWCVVKRPVLFPCSYVELPYSSISVTNSYLLGDQPYKVELLRVKQIIGVKIV